MKTTTAAVLALLLILGGCRSHGGSMFSSGDDGDGVQFDAPRNWGGLALIQGAINARGGKDACVSVKDPCTGRMRPISLSELEALVARVNAVDLCPDDGTAQPRVGLERLVLGNGERTGGGEITLSEGELLKLIEGANARPEEDQPSPPEPISQRSYPAPPPRGIRVPQRVASSSPG